MKERLLRLPRELGASGLAGIALICLVAAFALLVQKPLEDRNLELRERAARAQRGAAGAQPDSASGKVAAVYRFLEKEEETTDWLAKLHGIGTATGVRLKSATYRTQATDTPIERYEILLPVAGTYPQIRDFLKRALAEIPVLSVDQLTLKRESRTDGRVQAELRLTLHMVKS